MIQSSNRNRSEQLIYQKRQQDDNVNRLATKLRQENYEKTFAAWENKGKDISQTKYVNQRLKQLRDEANGNAAQRKQRLAELLAYEHQQYQQEILDSVETPEQVKERMIKQVNELKVKKEEERSKLAEKLNERRFRDNADELRQVNQNFNEIQTTIYRNMQMVEKQSALEQQYEEEMIYAQLYDREIKRKEKAEREKEIQAKIKADERNRIVAIQQQINQQKILQSQQELENEKAMLRTEWQKDFERYKEVQKQMHDYRLQVHHEIALNNEQQKEQKKQQKIVEKIEDKEMIRQVLEREEAIAKMEAAEKQRQKEETRHFLLNFKNRTNEYSINDQLKERLINEENSKQWDQREAVWKKEDEARIKLMYEVYDQRASNIEMKKKLKEQELLLKEQEKAQVQQQLSAYEQEQLEKQRIEQEKILKTKQNLLLQMDEKQQRQQLLKDKKLSEEEALRKQKEEYEKKIEMEKAKGRALLDELRKQRPY